MLHSTSSPPLSSILQRNHSPLKQSSSMNGPSNSQDSYFIFDELSTALPERNNNQADPSKIIGNNNAFSMQCSNKSSSIGSSIGGSTNTSTTTNLSSTFQRSPFNHQQHQQQHQQQQQQRFGFGEFWIWKKKLKMNIKQHTKKCHEKFTINKCHIISTAE